MRTDGHTDMTKIIVAFCNFASVPKMYYIFLWRCRPPPLSRGFKITHNDATHLVRLLWMSHQLVAGTSDWQHTTLSTASSHVPGGIRTRNLGWRLAPDLRLRPRGHWKRRLKWIYECITGSTSYCTVSYREIALSQIDLFASRRLGYAVYKRSLTSSFPRFVSGIGWVMW